ncbi:hypothetical protein EON65_46875 [archaeon]|nr:MAG: hypothetical protein EON65_46875 [archaeon]
MLTLKAWSAAVNSDKFQVEEEAKSTSSTSFTTHASTACQTGVLTDLFSIHVVFCSSTENKQTYHVSERKFKAQDLILLLLAAFAAQNDSIVLTSTNMQMIKSDSKTSESDEQQDDDIFMGEGDNEVIAGLAELTFEEKSEAKAEVKDGGADAEEAKDGEEAEVF